eukprot:CAMPEP_0119416382 /NCGR_PEP_ID=MMETSP1335-20130426/12828_1 /TAXON_ID=259385 /ORGANISM="Chrysoculter rhomboideus, Strain RCC1486" /LENGTH=153 /DNA_ID=CAMNT_0007441503 /DNA_START=60 /DNA_END=518 /DNA_ORIENTATION=-
MDIGLADMTVGATPATPFDVFDAHTPHRLTSSSSSPTATRVSSDASLADLYACDDHASMRPAPVAISAARAYVQANSTAGDHEWTATQAHAHNQSRTNRTHLAPVFCFLWGVTDGLLDTVETAVWLRQWRQSPCDHVSVMLRVHVTLTLPSAA